MMYTACIVFRYLNSLFQWIKQSANSYEQSFVKLNKYKVTKHHFFFKKLFGNWKHRFKQQTALFSVEQRQLIDLQMEQSFQKSKLLCTYLINDLGIKLCIQFFFLAQKDCRLQCVKKILCFSRKKVSFQIFVV